ncbi:MAG: tetratricopeptide repeat protein [Planctomycetota bacterium]
MSDDPTTDPTPAEGRTSLRTLVAAADAAIAAGDATAARDHASAARRHALESIDASGLLRVRRDWRMRILRELDLPREPRKPEQLQQSLALREAFLALADTDLLAHQQMEVLCEVAQLHLEADDAAAATEALQRDSLVRIAAADPLLRARIARLRVDTLAASDDIDGAVAEADRTLALMRDGASTGETAGTAIHFGMLFRDLGRHTDSQRCLALAEELGRDLRHCSWRRRVLEMLADVARELDQPDELILRLQQLLEAYQPRQINDRARTMCQLAVLQRNRDEESLADELEADAIGLFDARLDQLGDSGDAFVIARLLGQKGHCQRMIGQIEDAIDTWYEAIAKFEEAEVPGGLAWVADRLGGVLRTAGRLDEARRLLTRAVDYYASIDDPVEHSDTLNSLALVDSDAGDLHAALRLLDQAHAIHPNSGRASYDQACIWALAMRAVSDGPRDDLPPQEQCRANALDALERSIDEGWIHGQHIDEDHDLDLIRDDPRFVELRSRID